MAIEITSGDIFTPQQLSKHMKIYAGPGAGKTHFLVENIKNIVKTVPKVTNSQNRKVLCITYTNSAVEEIQRRLHGLSDAVEVNTIHGFITKHIIAPFQEDLKQIIKKDFNIEINSNNKITSQVEGLNILHGHDKEQIYSFINNELSATQEYDFNKKTMGEIQVNIQEFYHSRKSLLSYSKKFNIELATIIKKYIWAIACKLTHDEILYFGYRIIMENSTALYALRVKFPYIFIDEFQDTNPIQTLIIKKIGEKHSIVGIIGDIAQSIYSFQGAKPSEFHNLIKIGENNIVEYTIKGNRRSTNSIVQLCNYIRKSDTLKQKSIKPYSDNIKQKDIESKEIVFVIGESKTALALLNSVKNSGGVVLTRTWAMAFKYIQNISDEQKKVLTNIYNSYYVSSIDIRAEIVEHNYVSWVRAFRFIINLYEGHTTNSFIDVLSAFGLYLNIDKIKKEKLILTTDIISLKKGLKDLFKDIDDETLIVDIINRFNYLLLNDISLRNFLKKLGNDNFQIEYLTEYDNERLRTNLNKLEFSTAQQLFNEVFSKNSRYMTVHQAKGLEWDKVIVGVVPSKFDDTTLYDFWSNPRILAESSPDEFTRLYYVACSRAKEELYIHLSDASLVGVITENLDKHIESAECNLNYRFCY